MNTLLHTDPLGSKMKEMTTLSKEQMHTAADAALAMGFLSIVASILTWFFTKERDKAHSERFGIFIGLWVPSFFILANHLAHRADEK